MSMSDVPPELIDQLINDYLAEQDAMAMNPNAGNFFGAMTPFDLEGDPYTLTQQLNQLQDVNQIIADPVFQGAGGLGGFNAAQFQPTVMWETVESPEYVRWQNYRNTPDSFEGMIAAELEGGGTPLSAVRKIRTRVEAEPDGPLAAEIMALFGNEYGDAIDWQSVATEARGIDELRAEIPQIGNQGQTIAPDGTIVGGGEIIETVDEMGRPVLMRRTEEATPLMEKYDQLGMPYPTEEYEKQDFLPPEWGEQEQAYMGQLDAQQQAMDQWLAAQRELANFRPNQQNYPTPAAPPAGGGFAPTETTAGEIEAAYDVLGPQGNPAALGATGTFDEQYAMLRDIVTTPDANGNYVRPEEVVMDHAADFGWSEGRAAEVQLQLGAEQQRALAENQGRLEQERRPARDAALAETGTDVGGTITAPTGGGGTMVRGPRLPEGALPMSAIYGDNEPNPPGGAGPYFPIDPNQRVLPPYAQPGAQQARQPGDYTPQPPPLPPYAQPGAQQARQPGDYGTAGVSPTFDEFGGGNFEPTFPGSWQTVWGPTSDPFTAYGQTRQWVPDYPGYWESGGRRYSDMEDAMRATLLGPNPTFEQQRLENRATQMGPTVAEGTPPEPMTRQELEAALSIFPGQRMQTGEQPPIDAYAEYLASRGEVLGGAQEDQGRARQLRTQRFDTGEERAALARRNAPRGLQGEGGDVALSSTAGTGRRGRTQRARERWREQWLAGQQMKQQVYGADEGYARGLAAGMRARGITPTQQVYAQRMQNILNAGIPLGSNPRVVTL